MKLCGGPHGGNHPLEILYDNSDSIGCPLCLATTACESHEKKMAEKDRTIDDLEGTVAALEYDLEDASV
jgi:hypothetical protein